MLLYGTYISHWDEGSVFSPCAVSVSKQQVERVEISDDGEDYENLSCEAVELDINGVIFEFEAEQGELTANGQRSLKAELGKINFPLMMEGAPCQS